MNIRLSVSLGLLLMVSQAFTANAQTVEMETNKGTIVLELNAESAPITVQNFVDYANAGFYDGTIFHRVIKGFMIQGGGYGTDYQEKDTRDPIKLEAGKGMSNVRGSITMARTSVRDSATSQFFINLVDNFNLDNYDGGYAVFGKITKGMDVVDNIASIPTQIAHRQRNLPVEDVIIKSVKVLSAKPTAKDKPVKLDPSTSAEADTETDVDTKSVSSKGIIARPATYWVGFKNPQFRQIFEGDLENASVNLVFFEIYTRYQGWYAGTCPQLVPAGSPGIQYETITKYDDFMPEVRTLSDEIQVRKKYWSKFKEYLERLGNRYAQRGIADPVSTAQYLRETISSKIVI